jgi:glycosyltransferase involved in cell wall biosynthesis
MKTRITPSVFLLNSNRGWIMEAIAKESALAIDISPRFQYMHVSRRDLLNPGRLKTFLRPVFGKSSAFIHHSAYLRMASRIPSSSQRNTVFITHMEPVDFPSAKDFEILQGADVFVVQNSGMRDLLEERGISPDKVRVAYGAVSRNVYFPGVTRVEGKEGYVLVVGDCKPRKRPDLIEKIIDSMPHVRFVIHGKHWEEYTSLNSQPRKNLTYIPFELKNNPQLIRDADLLLSLAENEGGPFPVIEALASGTPVVATDTGFCSDVIKEACGILLPKNLTMSAIQDAITQTMSTKSKVFNLDLLRGKLTWEEFGRNLYL